MKCRKLVICILAALLCASPVYAAEALIPGGQIIGMELETEALLVAAFEEKSPARDAGVRIGDYMERINGERVQTSSDVEGLLQAGGDPVLLELRREGKTLQIQVDTGGTKRLGLYLKKGISGVGTVTFYDPADMTFGALGHGVCDKTGTLLTLRRGKALDASVRSVKKGLAGAPGQLMGVINEKTPLGSLEKNTPQGVFGTMKALPKTLPVPVAESHEVRTGDAMIRCTLEGTAPGEYSVRILKVYPGSGTRNLLVKVTDPALLETTGGIVQGMSGSPIIQDGKLVGAVTHVMVNDPQTGYGIFIENMLEAAG